MSAYDRLRRAMAAALGIDEGSVQPASKQGSVGAWDSLGQVHLMVAVEEEFDIRLEVEDFAKLTSVQDILEHLRAQGIE